MTNFVKLSVLLSCFMLFASLAFCYNVVLNMNDESVITGVLLSINADNVVLDPDGEATLLNVSQADIRTMFVNELNVNIPVPIVPEDLPDELKPVYYDKSDLIPVAPTEAEHTMTGEKSISLALKKPVKTARDMYLFFMGSGNFGIDFQGSDDIKQMFDPYFNLNLLGAELGVRLEAGYKGLLQLEYRSTSRSTSLVVTPDYSDGSGDDNVDMTLKSSQFFLKVSPWGFQHKNTILYLMYGLGSSHSLTFDDSPHTGYLDGTINTFGVELDTFHPARSNASLAYTGFAVEYEAIKYKTLSAEVDDQVTSSPFDTFVGTLRISFSLGFGFFLEKPTSFMP